MEKSNAGRKPLENRAEVRNMRFHFVFSEKEVENIGGKVAVYELVKNTIRKHIKDENKI
jgi:hypothetical protein